MAHDEGLAELFWGDLAGISGITGKKMLGGLCFLLVGGVHGDFGMMRVGKGRIGAARAMEGAGPMTFTGRKTGGFVECLPRPWQTTRRGALLALAIENARSLPPK